MSKAHIAFLYLRLFCLAALVFGETVAGFAQSENASESKPTLRSRLRREAFSEIAFKPKRGEEIPAVFLHVPAPLPDEVDPLSLDPMIVTDAPLPRGLHEKILANQENRKLEKPKLGTGVYRKDFKRVRLEVGSILYIPIAVGISW